MPRYEWSHLNRQQVGAYTEYFVKMEFTMLGFQVYRNHPRAVAYYPLRLGGRSLT